MTSGARALIATARSAVLNNRSSRRAAGDRSRSRIGSSGCTALTYAASPGATISISGVFG
jgi:hypothetical protein